MRKQKIAAIVAAFALLGGASAAGILWPTGQIIYGLQLNGHSISNQSREDVEQYIKQVESEANTKSITIVDSNGAKKTMSLRELGITVDIVGTLTDSIDHGYESNISEYVWHRMQAIVGAKNLPIRYKMDGPTVENYLLEYAKSMGETGSNATITLEGDTIVHHSAKVGRKLDIPATIKRLQEQLQEGNVETLDLVINEAAQPTIQDKDLESITNVLGTYTTHFDSSNTSRAHNIHLAGQKIHQTYIPAGGVFSFNEVVGERTAEAGYDDAPVFVGGRLVPGIGGGICQISSTLFNSALLAGMDIVERDTHFAPVSYIPVGLDATVAWGYIDFKFKNPYSHPIYVITEEGNGYVKISILGAKEDVPQSVSITKSNERTVPNQVIERVDPNATEDVVESTGHAGISVDTTRTITYGDGRTATYTFNSYYEPVESVVVKAGKPKQKDVKEAKEDQKQEGSQTKGKEQAKKSENNKR